MLTDRAPHPIGAGLLAALLAACSASPDGSAELGAVGSNPDGTPLEAAPQEDGLPTSVSEEPRTLARVVVERSLSADGAKSAQAMAHFVELYAGSDRSLALVGLELRLPDVDSTAGGNCRGDAVAPATLDGMVELELLDAGSVEVRLTEVSDTVGDTRSVVLAPHAFPSVSSFASGLVYTTRDRSADALPGQAHYDIVVDGARSVPYLEFGGEAPSELEQVSLGGVPLSEIGGVDAALALEVSWQAGSATDLVYIELTSPDDTERRVVCAFADSAGTGAIPAHLVESVRGDAHFAIHRLRRIAASNAARLATELRFDFELDRALVLGDQVYTVTDAHPADDAAEVKPAVDASSP